MKVESTKDNLILWKPVNIGEFVFGEYEKMIDTKDGNCVLLQAGKQKILVPLTATLQKHEDHFYNGVHVLVAYMGTKQGKENEYKVVHALFFEAENESEEHFLESFGSTIWNKYGAIDNPEEVGGAHSGALVSDSEVIEFLQQAGLENYEFAKLEN